MLVVLYLLQTTVLEEISVAGIKPNIIILMPVFIGYKYGKIPGILMGFFTGLLLDMMEGSYLGFYALMYLLIGYLNGFVKKIYHKDYTVIPLFLIGISDLTLNLMFFISGFLVRNRLDFFYYLIRIMLPELIYTVVISVLLYKGLDFLFYQPEKISPKVNEETKGGEQVD